LLERLADDLLAAASARAEVLWCRPARGAGAQRARPAAGRPAAEDSQAAAAVGQIALARIWAQVLAERGLVAGQILVTFGDTEERRRISMRAKPQPGCSICARCRSSTRTTRCDRRDPLLAITTGSRARRHHASADLLVPAFDVDGLYTPRRV